MSPVRFYLKRQNDLQASGLDKVQTCAEVLLKMVRAC